MRVRAFEELPQVAEKSLHVGVLMHEADQAAVGAQHEYVETVAAQQAKNLDGAGLIQRVDAVKRRIRGAGRVKAHALEAAGRFAQHLDQRRQILVRSIVRAAFFQREVENLFAESHRDHTAQGLVHALARGGEFLQEAGHALRD